MLVNGAGHQLPFLETWSSAMSRQIVQVLCLSIDTWLQYEFASHSTFATNVCTCIHWGHISHLKSALTVRRRQDCQKRTAEETVPCHCSFLCALPVSFECMVADIT